MEIFELLKDCQLSYKTLSTFYPVLIDPNYSYRSRDSHTGGCHGNGRDQRSLRLWKGDVHRKRFFLTFGQKLAEDF